jgi:hypothetical protein
LSAFVRSKRLKTETVRKTFAGLKPRDRQRLEHFSGGRRQAIKESLRIRKWEKKSNRNRNWNKEAKEARESEPVKKRLLELQNSKPERSKTIWWILSISPFKSWNEKQGSRQGKTEARKEEEERT